MSFLDKIDSIIMDINLYIDYNKNDLDLNKLEDVFLNKRISNVCLYNSKLNSKLIENKYSQKFYLYNGAINPHECGVVSKEYFSVNQSTYFESISFNSCLNKKISIDKEGNVKNCPSMPQSFGNIKDTTLEEALNHPDFKKYWNVTKDMIEFCKDCEFRHICTDCRAYTERSNFEGEIDLSKPLKCGYNPYTNDWAEWSTNPLKQNAIEYYGMQELIQKDA